MRRVRMALCLAEVAVCLCAANAQERSTAIVSETVQVAPATGDPLETP